MPRNTTAAKLSIGDIASGGTRRLRNFRSEFGELSGLAAGLSTDRDVTSFHQVPQGLREVEEAHAAGLLQIAECDRALWSVCQCGQHRESRPCRDRTTRGPVLLSPLQPRHESVRLRPFHMQLLYSSCPSCACVRLPRATTATKCCWNWKVAACAVRIRGASLSS